MKIKLAKAAVLCGVIFTAITIAACSKQSDKPVTTATPSSSRPASALEPVTSQLPDSWASGSAAGVTWRIPGDWEIGAPAPMRAGTYLAGAAEGDDEGAECRVNYFGQGQGGEVQQNIDRWQSQMEISGQEGVFADPLVSRVKVNGLNVSMVELSGTYLSKSRPMALQFTRKVDFKMFAAIVQAPGGMLFFKMTGPAKTMELQRQGFRQIVGSLSVL
ncbi:MAG: hypothetical protein IH914_09850 [candidate division Zixibacteria bacterium]|nr:hypothetical protein [candidate division Zixibacteria bacterium]